MPLILNHATRVGDVGAQAAENAAGIGGGWEQIELLRLQTQRNKDEIKREVLWLQQQLAETRNDLMDAVTRKK